MLLLIQSLQWLLLLSFITQTYALANSVTKRSQLHVDLQKCVEPEQVLEAVIGASSSPLKIDSSLASLVLVRLVKQLVGRDNNNREQRGALLSDLQVQQVRQIAASLISSPHSSSKNLEALTEGTKAYSALLRLLQKPIEEDEPIIHFWNDCANDVASRLEPHQLSGLKWSFDTLNLLSNNDEAETALPTPLQEAYNDLNLPFTILPGCLKDVDDLSVERLTSEVEFRVDDIRTSSNAVVKERRQTEWQGDDSCGPFLYSEKSMPRSDWSPVVKRVRDELHQVTKQYYDGCLLNLYNHGQSGMRYHIDPDQGTLWDYKTAVVSVGATRRFAFRSIIAKEEQRPHNFLVLHGDVTYMFGDCQERFQHAVKKADNRNDDSPRASLVFKRTWNHEL